MNTRKSPSSKRKSETSSKSKRRRIAGPSTVDTMEAGPRSTAAAMVVEEDPVRRKELAAALHAAVAGTPEPLKTALRQEIKRFATQV
jgi:hypothetical protein